jgi:ribosomal protein S18 acetylase RimI-like enzyme
VQQVLTISSEPSISIGPTPAKSPAERNRAQEVITLGFANDPIARWFWPDADDYLFWMPRFVAAFSGGALDHGTADLTPCGRAAAFWLPRDIHPDEQALDELIADSIPPHRRAEVDAFVGQMEEFHPEESCWHLAQIAADLPAQGQGLGSQLLTYGLRRCDAELASVYLESSNPRNVPLYERFGFVVIGEIQAGSSPVMHPMLRRPR